MSLMSWLRIHNRARTPAARPGLQPRLEALDDRWVPSTLTVTSIADKGAGSLRADIAAAQSGDTIVFAPSLDGQTITLRTELLINKNLTITGPSDRGVTVSGNNASRVFEVAQAMQVNLSGLTISNGHAVNGGGIMVDTGAGLALSNSVISYNSVTNTKNNYYVTYGGGLDNYGTTLVYGCTVSGNSSLSGGSGIDNHATLTVSASTVTGNTARWGPAIENETGSTLEINSNSTVSGNDNGGIRNLGTATISDSALSGNSGSAIYNSAGATVTVRDSLISNNSADEGGAINNTGTATLSNCTLSDNSASEYGGAIYLSSNFSSGSGTLNMSGCTLSGNYSKYDSGGGIYITAGAATISNCTLSGNTAAAGVGGGINLYGGFGATLTMTGSTLSGNSALSGGGIFIQSGSAVYLDASTAANIVNNTDNSGLNGPTANVDGPYTLLP